MKSNSYQYYNILFCCFLIWGSFTLFTTYHYTQVDEIAFKSAGREWAQTGSFSSPELIGFRNFSPDVSEVWLAQLPFYSFAFGVYTKLTGFNAISSRLFDVLVQILLCCVTFLHIKQVAPNKSKLAIIAALLILPLFNPGRADTLGALVGLSSLSIYLNHPGSLVFNICAALTLGITCATSLASGIIYGLTILIYYIFNSYRSREVKLVPFFIRTLVLGLTIILGFILGLAPALLENIQSIKQFIQHASEETFISHKWGLEFSFTYGKFLLLPLIASFVTLITTVLFYRNQFSLIVWLPVLTTSAFIFVFFPSKYYYLINILPLAIAACVHSITSIKQILIPAIIYLIGSSSHILKQSFILFYEDSQRSAFNVKQIRNSIPEGSSVYSSQFWAELANDYNYQSMVHSNVSTDDIEYLILHGFGTGMTNTAVQNNLTKQLLQDNNYEIVYNNLPSESVNLFGKKITNSAWGVGVQIIKNNGYQHDSN